MGDVYEQVGHNASRPNRADAGLRPRGWRALLIAALVVALPILEIWLLVVVGRQVGLLPVLLVVFAGIAVGSWLIRRRWRNAWNSLLEASRSGELGARSGRSERAASGGVADTAVFVLGGFALMFPGLITDLIGLICLIPFTRVLPRRLLQNYVDRRVDEMTAMTGVPGFGPRPSARYGDGDVIHGEVVDDSDSGEPNRGESGDAGRRSGAGRPDRSPLIIPAEPDDDRRS